MESAAKSPRSPAGAQGLVRPEKRTLHAANPAMARRVSGAGAIGGAHSAQSVDAGALFRTNWTRTAAQACRGGGWNRRLRLQPHNLRVLCK